MLSINAKKILLSEVLTHLFENNKYVGSNSNMTQANGCAKHKFACKYTYLQKAFLIEAPFECNFTSSFIFLLNSELFLTPVLNGL